MHEAVIQASWFVQHAQIDLHTHTLFFFFNDTATTEIYTLSLHDALPISLVAAAARASTTAITKRALLSFLKGSRDRKSTRLNSSHSQISYAVFCLKKKKLG